jgi:hypothetical protein
VAASEAGIDLALRADAHRLPLRKDHRLVYDRVSVTVRSVQCPEALHINYEKIRTSP